MAYDTINALGHNTYGQMTDVDKANFNSQQSAEDYILRKRMQDDALKAAADAQQRGFGQQDTVQSKDFAQQLLTGGTFGEREGRIDARQDRVVAPALLREQNDEAWKQKEWAQGAPERELKTRLMGEFTNGIFPTGGTATPGTALGTAPGGAPGAAPGSAPGYDRKRLADIAAFLGHQLPADPNEVRQQHIQDVQDMLAMQNVQNNGRNSGAASAYLKKRGIDMPTDVFADTSKPIPTGLDLSYVKDSAISRAKEFAHNASKTFGWNPTDDDVDAVVKSRDELRDALTASNPDISIENATMAANKMIDDQLKGADKGMGAGPGWVTKLRQRLGVSSSPLEPLKMFDQQEPAPRVGNSTLGAIGNFLTGGSAPNLSDFYKQ